jgi:hypothetical protein
MTEVATPGVGKYYTKLTIGKYKRQTPFAKPDDNPGRQLIIILPLPNELRDDTSVSYTNINLETVGDLINGSAISGVGAAVLRNSGDIVRAAGTSIGNAIANMSGTTGGSSSIAGAIGSLFPADQITSAIQQSAGIAPNPNPSVAFQGPVLRDFSYTWAFYPKSKDESEKIQRMIKILKRSALPRNTLDGTTAILDYPDMVQVNFFPWDSGGTGTWKWSEKSIVKYKKCFMQAINVNYHPFGTPAFFEGSNLPVTYQLTISFRETEYMLSKDWSDTMYGPIAPSGISAEIDTTISGAFRAVANGAAGVLSSVSTTAAKLITGLAES